MFHNMLEVKLDLHLKKYIVSPLNKKGKEDYLILCDSELIAKSLCAQISMELIPSPLTNPSKYSSFGVHPNGHTRILKYKK